MASLANGIDFLANIFSSSNPKLGSVDHSGLEATILICYALFGACWMLTLGIFSDSDFSLVITGGAFFQCLGFTLLCMKVRATKSVEGISAKSLTLFVLYYITRIFATSMKNGYVPVDATGDYVYQLTDVASLVCVLHLLFCVHKTHVHSYQEEADSLSIKPLITISVVLGTFVHGNFNQCEFFDTVWATSLNLETFAMVPQLWMMAKVGGKVDNSTAHFVMCTVMSSVCRFVFWWYAFPELYEDEEGDLAAEIAGYYVIFAHIAQLLLGADFMFYYAQAWLGGTSVVLPAAGEIEM